MILEQWLLTTKPIDTGKIYTVGLNATGQLGLNNVTFQNSPVQIDSLSWKSVSAGISHTLAIRSDGLLFAWGLNTYGSIGANSALRDDHKSSPVQIGSSTWSQIDTKGFHSLARTTDNRLFAWGLNNFGQLGDGTTNNTDKLKSYSILQVYHRARYLIDYENRLWVWSTENHSGAPGTGTASGTAITSPIQVPGSWSNVWAASDTGFFVASNNSLWASGFNSGKFGNNTNASTSTPVMVSANNEYSFITATLTQTVLALKPNGSLWAWGANTSILGVAPIPSGNRSSPVQLGTASWTMISAGASHAMGIRTDGSLWAWGVNTYGQLGTNANTNILTPVQIGSNSWNAVAAGQDYTLGIGSNAKLYGWGRNVNGHFAVGDGTSIDRSSPVQVAGVAANSSFVYVSASKSAVGANMSAIDANGAIWRWGNRDSFQNFSGGADFSVPTIATAHISYPQGVSVTHIFSNGGYVNFRANTGNVYTTGLGDRLAREDLVSDSRGVFLVGQASHRISPVQVGISSWNLVSAGLSHTLAIRSDNTLWAWGTATSGVLGLPGNTYTSVSHRSSPVQVGTDTWKDISAGLSHSIGVTSNNELYAWGNNTNYAVGTPYSYSMVGDAFTYLRTDGKIESTFTNDVGQYGNSTTDQTIRFAHVLLNSSKSWRFVRASGSQKFAIDENYKLFAWGWNAFGQLGDGTSASRSSPVQIGNNSWSTISCGEDYHAGIQSDGGLFFWGRHTLSTEGVFGDNTNIGKNSPVKVGSNSWSVISTAGYTAMGIRSDGKLFGWGRNSSGQLGNSSNTNVSSPVQIGSDSWTSVAAGGGHTAAIKYDGTLWTWGNNGSGQLGDNTTVFRSSPVQISSASWKHVFAGSYYGYQATFAIRDNGSLFAFGNASSHRLGDGTTINKSSPVQLYSSSSFTMVNGDHERAVGLTIHGNLILWGDNASGQLLNGGTGGATAGVTRPIIQFPSKIANGAWSQVSAGSAHSMAIDASNYLYGWGHPTAAEPTKFASWSLISTGQQTWTGIRSDGKLFGSGNGFTAINAGTIVQVGADTWSYVSNDGFTGHIGIKSDKSLWTWTGNLTSLTQHRPGDSWVYATNRGGVNIAIRTDGALFTWGSNFYGQLGQGTANVTVTTPVQVGTSSWIFAVTNGTVGQSVAALRSDGTIFCWGRNNLGQLGDNTIIDRSSPVQISGTNIWANTGTPIGGTERAFFAISSSNGALWGWGGGDSFLLTTRSSPAIVNSSSWVHVAGGDSSLLAISFEGRLYGIGRDDSGQLGVGNTASARSITEVFGGGSWTQISHSKSATGGIKLDGSTYIWGSASSYITMGEGTVTNRSSPTQIGFDTEPLRSPTLSGTSQWKSISAGANYTLGVKTDNILYSWGANYVGAMGFPLVRTTPTPYTYFGVKGAAGLSHAALLVTANTY